MIAELDTVVLLRDLPEYGLVAGELGSVVHVYRGGAGFEVEFVAPDGRTLAIATLDPASVRLAAEADLTRVAS